MDAKQKAMNKQFIKSVNQAGLDRFSLGMILTRGQAAILYQKSLQGPVTPKRPNTRRTPENVAASAADNYLRDPEKASTRVVTTQLLLLVECIRVLHKAGYNVSQPEYSDDGRLLGFPRPEQARVSKRKPPGGSLADHELYKYVRTTINFTHVELVELFNLYEKASSEQYRYLQAYLSECKELPPTHPKHKGIRKTHLPLLDVLLFMHLEGYDLKGFDFSPRGTITTAPMRA